MVGGSTAQRLLAAIADEIISTATYIIIIVKGKITTVAVH